LVKDIFEKCNFENSSGMKPRFWMDEQDTGGIRKDESNEFGFRIFVFHKL
jgi:hypothetical protein